VTMLTAILTTILLVTLVFIPLAWRIRADRRRNRADIVRADILSSVNRKLGGESLLTVEVVPETLGRPGRIVLRTPEGYEDLADAVWRDVVKRAPAGYDLIVRPARARQPAAARRAA